MSTIESDFDYLARRAELGRQIEEAEAELARLETYEDPSELAANRSAREAQHKAVGKALKEMRKLADQYDQHFRGLEVIHRKWKENADVLRLAHQSGGIRFGEQLWTAIDQRYENFQHSRQLPNGRQFRSTLHVNYLGFADWFELESAAIELIPVRSREEQLEWVQAEQQASADEADFIHRKKRALATIGTWYQEISATEGRMEGPRHGEHDMRDAILAKCGASVHGFSGEELKALVVEELTEHYKYYDANTRHGR